MVLTTKGLQRTSFFILSNEISCTPRLTDLERIVQE
jgi:hypothetical protein